MEGLVYSIVAGYYDFHDFDWDQDESSVLQSLSADKRLTNVIIQQMEKVVTKVINLRKSNRSIVRSRDELSPFCRAIHYPESINTVAEVFPIIERDSEGNISCLLSSEQITARIIAFMASNAAAVNSKSTELYVEWERPYYLYANYRTWFRISRKNVGKIEVQQEEGLIVTVEKMVHMNKPLNEAEIGIFEEQADDWGEQAEEYDAFACFEVYDVERTETRTLDVGISLNYIQELVQRWLKEDETDLNEWGAV
jgi:hypothetical protein